MVRLAPRVVVWILVLWTAFASYHFGRWTWRWADVKWGARPVDGQWLLADYPVKAGWIGSWWLVGVFVLGLLWWGLRVAAKGK